MTKADPWIDSYPTKTDLAKAWSDWFKSKDNEWEVFTVTVVFKSGGPNSNQSRWEDEYKKRVLSKIRRKLERNKNNQAKAIPYEDFFYYEKNEASIHRKTGSRKPHHIHGLLPIKKDRSYRIWSVDDMDLVSTVRADIQSIDTVESIHFRKLNNDHAVDWIRYCWKGKSLT